MAGLSWLTDELWRGHCTADIQLPSYPYVFSSYTNNNKKLFHKDAQHLMCEEENTGHTWYNGFVNIGLLLTKRITTASKEQTIPEYSYSAILKWCIKNWLLFFLHKSVSKSTFCHPAWTLRCYFSYFQGSQVLFTDTNMNRIFWCALTCCTNSQINKQSQQIFSSVISTFDVAQI